MVELQELVAHDEVKKEIIEPWQEVVKAKDQAIDSVMQMGQQVLDVEPVQASLYAQSSEDDGDVPSEMLEDDSAVQAPLKSESPVVTQNTEPGVSEKSTTSEDSTDG